MSALAAGALLVLLLLAAPAAQATGKTTTTKPKGSISGAKWHDLNANGTRDQGEPAIAGWVLYIDANGNDALDAGERTAVTNANGEYAFTNVAIGTHTVREAGDAQQLPTNQGFKCSFPTNAACEHVVAFTLTGGGSGHDDGKKTDKTCDERSRLEDAVALCEDDDEFDDECGDSGTTGGKTGDSGKGDSHSSKGGASDSGKGDSHSSKGGGKSGGASRSDTGGSHGGKSGDGKSGGSKESGTKSASASSAGMAYAFLAMMDSGDWGDKGDKGGKGDDSGHDTEGDDSNDNSGHDTAGDSDTGNETHTGGGGGGDCAVDGVDFGNYREASISGKKVEDTNANGKADKGEGGLAGFTFYVDADDDGVMDAGEPSATSGADGTWTITGLKPGTYKVREVPRAGWECTTDGCAREVTLDSGETKSVVFTNRNKPSAIQVTKNGPATAKHGDSVTFTFDVRNTGEQALSDVAVTDDKCSPLTLVGKAGGDQDDLLEGSEVWSYSCTTTVPAHADGEANPLTNTVTATAKDEEGDTVTDDDSHDTTIEHPQQPPTTTTTPRIAIDKTGPATARAGESVTYTLVVTNPGDVAFPADRVSLTDEMCSPSLLAKRRGNDPDATPDSLDPGDQWHYTCTVVTQQSWTGVVNVALVRATTPDDRTVVANDDATTTLTRPQIQVLPETIVSGRARLRGPSGCVGQSFRAVVTGRQIRSVTFEVDGRRVKRLGAGKTRYVVRVNTRGLSRGVHRVTAKVRFTTRSRTPSRTLRFVFQRCARQVILPRFTG